MPTGFGSLFRGVALLCASFFLVAADLDPLAPPDGAEMTHTVPAFRWRPPERLDPAAIPETIIQIARDRAFRDLVDEDRLAGVISWYVPDREIPPGTYWWRVSTGAWSPARRLVIKAAPVFRVQAGATFEEIRDVIRKASAKTPARVIFEKGEYRLDPGGPNPLIELEDVEDFAIDGGGSVIILTRAASIARFVRCRRVLVKGFTFDYDPPVYTAGRIISVDRKAGSFEADILPGHVMPDGHPAFERERKGLVVTAEEGYAIKRGVRLVISHAGCRRLEGRRCRFQLENRKNAARLAPGDIYVLDPRWYSEGGGTTIKASGGEDVALLDLTLYGAANECLNSFYADRHAILHVRLLRRPGRALSVNNGGNNHHNARTGPWIEGCRFENTGDDICHVNGYSMGVEAQPSGDRLVFRLRQPYDQFGAEAGLDLRRGDRLQFFNRAEGRLLGERRIVSVKKAGDRLEVRLDTKMEGIVTGRLRKSKTASHTALEDASVTQVFNVSRGCSQFVFRRNTCRAGRRVGVLAKGYRGLIEENVFEDMGGGGVEFWNAPFEGLGAEDYVVRRNRMVNCLRLDRKHAAIWSSAFRPDGSRIHRNLLIEENEITGGRLPALRIGDAEGVVLRRNRISLPGEAVELRNTVRVVRE